MTTLQMRSKGTITFPAKLRKKYNLEEGEVFTIIDLGDGSFLLKPRAFTMDRISKQAEKILEEDEANLEDIFIALREERKRLFKEKYGEVKKVSNGKA